MKQYRLWKPIITMIDLGWHSDTGWQKVECLMASAYDPVFIHASGIFFETTEKDVIDKFRPYIEKANGGNSDTEVKIPKEVNHIDQYRRVEYDLGDAYVKKYNQFNFGENALIANVNGIAYLQAIQTPDDPWWLIKENGPITYLNPMPPVTYKKIDFLCKWNDEINTYAEGWNPKDVGERIKDQFFFKYIEWKYPKVPIKEQ